VLGRGAGRTVAFPDAFRSSLIYVIVLDVALAALVQLLPPNPTRAPTRAPDQGLTPGTAGGFADSVGM